jgi:hypothetical protein
MDALLAELKALREKMEALDRKVTAPASHVVTVDQAAELLHCKRRRVFQYLEQGLLRRGKRHGRETTITLASIDALNAPDRAAIPDAPTSVAPLGFNPEREAADLDAFLRSQGRPTRDPAGGQRTDRPQRAPVRKSARKPSR